MRHTLVMFAEKSHVTRWAGSSNRAVPEGRRCGAGQGMDPVFVTRTEAVIVNGLRIHGARPGQTRRTRLAGAVLIAGFALVACHFPGGDARTAELPVRESLEAARDFAPRVEAFLGSLPLDREAFSLRINACEGRQGEARGDIYYVWAGMRGVAPGGDAADILESVHARWQEDGWTITRYRRLPNGGVNIAATEPATGAGYSLDSGFKQDPGGYVVAYFNTACYRSPSGAVAFGDLRQGLD